MALRCITRFGTRQNYGPAKYCKARNAKVLSSCNIYRDLHGNAAAVTDKVSADDIQSFQEDGAVAIRNIVSMDWVEKMRRVIEDAKLARANTTTEHEHGEKGVRFFEDQFMWQRHPDARALVFDSRIRHLAAKLMDSNKISFFYDQILSKDPGTKSPTPWHNDISYWHLKGWKICSVWLALDPVGEDIGVRYWKGSHKLDIRHRLTTLAGQDAYAGNTDPPLPDINHMVDTGQIQLLSWTLQPGDVLVHHGSTVHYAPGNNTSQRRRGYVTRYLGDDVTFDRRPGTMLQTWESLGLVNGLKDGERMVCDMHPNVPL